MYSLWISTYVLKSSREYARYSSAFGASTFPQVTHHCETTKVTKVSHLTHQHCWATREKDIPPAIEVTTVHLAHQHCGATRERYIPPATGSKFLSKERL